MMRLLAALLLSLGLLLNSPARAQDLLVFAAASLKNALDEINQGQAAGQAGVKVSYAASSALARQVEAGAPADLFISADLDWMDYLQQRNLVRNATRTNLLGNRLSLIAPADSKAAITLGSNANLAALLGPDGRLAMGDMNAVPAGKYGKAALDALNIWPQVANRVAQAENVRAALALVARGEAPLGIVYRTDAASEPKVRVVSDFPENTHPPIIYPAAALAGGKQEAAAAYLARLRSPAAAAIFTKHGFALLPADAKIN
ncbi:molybdate ABC transporter substrate-binding protein [Ferrovibrio sp.]|uniref:molybdate ABC transporter substrate-binding protein n=1 Tax=Ferrovibrio sp. TaxID=1917215 RepID=UPI003D29A52E